MHTLMFPQASCLILTLTITRRHQHIVPMLQRSLLEPASLSELRAAWSSPPIFDPHISTLRLAQRLPSPRAF